MNGTPGRSLLFATTIALAACTTGNIQVGSGPITLSPDMAAYYQQFLDERNPGYFAVTADGTTAAGYSFCQDSRCLAGGKAGAIHACERNTAGRPCHLFAFKQTVLWQGPVSFEAEAGAVRTAARSPTPRPLIVAWQGRGEPFEVPLEVDPNSDEGPIAFSLPGDRAACSGSYSAGADVSYDWTLSCTDGTSAAGTFNYYSSVDEGAGIGADNAGRKIRLTLLPSA